MLANNSPGSVEKSAHHTVHIDMDIDLTLGTPADALMRPDARLVLKKIVLNDAMSNTLLATVPPLGTASWGTANTVYTM
jgi:hypothetical protein